jgi:hypothetical protein
MLVLPCSACLIQIVSKVFRISHLRFKGVDVADPDYPICILNSTQNDISRTFSEVDIDKLSRLEIEVISLFLPLLDHQIQRRLVPRIEGTSKYDYDDIVVLIDIPNLLAPP